MSSDRRCHMQLQLFHVTLDDCINFSRLFKKILAILFLLIQLKINVISFCYKLVKAISNKSELL